MNIWAEAIKVRGPKPIAIELSDAIYWATCRNICTLLNKIKTTGKSEHCQDKFTSRNRQYYCPKVRLGWIGNRRRMQSVYGRRNMGLWRRLLRHKREITLTPKGSRRASLKRNGFMNTKTGTKTEAHPTLAQNGMIQTFYSKNASAQVCCWSGSEIKTTSDVKYDNTSLKKQNHRFR